MDIVRYNEFLNTKMAGKTLEGLTQVKLGSLKV